jgi:hypothetical protein
MALRAFAAVLPLLLELEDNLDLAAGLGLHTDDACQENRGEEHCRDAGHRRYPGIWASSGSLSQTGIHSATVRPTARAFALTSAAKAWRTSSLSRILSRYFR